MKPNHERRTDLYEKLKAQVPPSPYDTAHDSPYDTAHDDMRQHARGPAPSGVTAVVHTHGTGGSLLPEHGAYSTTYHYAAGSHDTARNIVGGQLDVLRETGKRHTVDFTVHPSPAFADAAAKESMAKDPRLNPRHEDYEHSGVARSLIESSHHDAAAEKSFKFREHVMPKNRFTAI
jgi:hypothetical protein